MTHRKPARLILAYSARRLVARVPARRYNLKNFLGPKVSMSIVVLFFGITATHAQDYWV
jgi:hypothetical protein